MRRAIRGVAVVCLLAISTSLVAAPREAKGGSVVKRIMKKIKAFGDLITIPGV